MKKYLSAAIIFVITAVIASAWFVSRPSTVPSKTNEIPSTSDVSIDNTTSAEEKPDVKGDTDKQANNREEAVTEPSVPKTEQKPKEITESANTDENTADTHKCTLSVRCDTAVTNISRLTPEKAEIIPKDGVIYPKREVTFNVGESVFNVLLREMKLNRIHFEFENTPIYKSAYVEGISNLYEFDCGELSGWVYRVNGSFPNYGCSKYTVNDGDVIEWIYTCDLGNDVGGRNIYTEE